MMQETLQMRSQHTLHTSIGLHNSHGKDMGQMLSTEYSNKQRLNPKEEYSASYRQQVGMNQMATDTFVMVFYKSQQSCMKGSRDNSMRNDDSQHKTRV